MITPSFSLTATERVLPKLALDFTTAVLDPRVTFTRTTNATNPATYVNSSGILTAATNNQPRFDYNPVTLQCDGLLIEESRSNILLYSDQFNNNTVWPKNTSTVTQDAITAPDGTLSGDKLITTAATAAQFAQQTISVTSGTTYSYSCYVKKGELNYLQLRFNNTAFSSSEYATFDVDSGIISQSSGTGHTIKNAGNGWYRCTIVGVASATTASAVVYLQLCTSGTGGRSPTITGNGTSGIYIWGAQCELGAFSTSYIPTTSASLTRNADVATMTGTNFSDWYNASEGSFSTTFSSFDSVTGRNSTAISIDDTTSTNRIQIGRNVSTASARGIVVNSTTQASISSANSSLATNTFASYCFAYKQNSFMGGFNGTALTPDNTGTLPTVLQMQIGNGTGTNYLNGYISKISYWPQRLINAEVQSFSKG